MVVGKVLIVLLGASVLVGNRQKRLWLQTSRDSLGIQVGLKPGEVLRDRLKNGKIVDIYLSDEMTH